MCEGNYKYRLDRIDRLVKGWDGEKLHDLMAAFNISGQLFKGLELATMLFVSRALGFCFSSKDEFMSRINGDEIELANVTPNGRVMPKKEYQLEYNLVLRNWYEIMSHLHRKDESLINRIRLYPSIRIKAKNEIIANANRPYRTNLPHSDAWVDGFWGLNIHIPLLGSTEKNRLRFYELEDPSNFRPEMFVLGKSKSFEEMQWVRDYYIANDNIMPKPGFVYISDYSLLHGSYLESDAANARVSIDTCLIIGNYSSKDDHPEFVSEIPPFGVEDFCVTPQSIHGGINDKTNLGLHDEACFVQNISGSKRP